MASNALQTAGTMEKLKSLVEAHKDKLSLYAGTEKRARQIADKALMEIHKNPVLLKCTPSSLFFSIREAIANGLEIGGIRPMAYLVPFGDKVTLIPSYLGLTELVRRTGNLQRHMMEVVYEGDDFAFALGDNPYINHIPKDTPDRSIKKVTHVYAIFWMHDGAIHRSVWTTARVDAHKKRYSKTWSKADSAWQTSWEAMAKKTVLRDMVNRGIVAIQERLFEGATSLMDRVDEPVDQVLDEAPAIEHHQPALNVEVLPDPVQSNDDLWNRYEIALDDCASLGALTTVKDEFLPLFSGDDKDLAEDLSNKTADRIRAEKAERAKA